jgi:hypothetical protein
MTFLEAALDLLRREGKPLHYKELTERALGKKLLTFVGRTPEVTMQTQLTAAVKKAPGNPFVRVKPGVFGLLRYPELTPEEREEHEAPQAAERTGAGRSSPSREEGGGANGELGGGRDGRRGRRRRRGRGRVRGEGEALGAAGGGAVAAISSEADQDETELVGSGMSAEARAAALAETGVLEADDDDDVPGNEEDETSMEDDDGATAGQAAATGEGRGEDDEAARRASPTGESDEDASLGAEGDDGDDDESAAEGEEEPGLGGAPMSPSGEPGPGRRRRRRRRRGRGSEGEAFGGGAPSGGEFGGPAPVADAGSFGNAPAGDAAAPAGEGSAAGGTAPSPGMDNGDRQGPRRIMTPVDAALEILRGQAPGRGVHVRQIADAAARRKLVHGEPNEAWRVMRTALAAEPRERLRAGMRPRVRAAGAGLYALARRPPDPELERAEQVFGEARRALRERTLAALERRIAELPGSAFEALARVLLQREGFGPATFVKRVDGTVYVEAMRGRGARPSKCLIGLRFGGASGGRRAIGELRAGIKMRGQDEGLLMLAGRLGEDAISEWKQPGPPVEIADGPALAETCVRHGVGVVNTMVSVDFVDADFFADIAEG